MLRQNALRVQSKEISNETGSSRKALGPFWKFSRYLVDIGMEGHPVQKK